MAEKHAVSKQLTKRYRRASKKEKGEILDTLCSLTGYSRDHAARLLRAGPPPKRPKRRRARSRTYDTDVLFALRKVWATLDGICGKRLAAAIPHVVPAMEHYGELMVSSEVRNKLLVISPATIDRMLAPDRARVTLKGRAGTKPGTLLKHQIPVRTFAEWDDAKAGFVEIDLVGHDGGTPRGDYCQTLDVTCVTTGWTETRAVRNKAQVHVFAALKEIRSALPFPLLGIDSDNGSEFINDHLLRYCKDQADHLHPLAALQEERQLLRRAEELERGAPQRRLRAFRLSGGARSARRALRGAARAHELLHAERQAHLQDSEGRQGAQALRHAQDALRPRARIPRRDGRGEAPAEEAL